MKRTCVLFLCLTLCLSLFAPCALANSWGLTGELYRAVASVHTWDDYTAMGKQAGNAAVMESRYHNALMLSDESARNGLRVYTKAVYQPGEALASKATLSSTQDGFMLSYGKDERYTFAQLAGGYVLKEAVNGDFRLSCEIVDVGGGMQSTTAYTASNWRETAVWNAYVPLQDFNITLLPRSVEEVRALNLMRAVLAGHDGCLGWWEEGGEPGMLLSNIGNGTTPVYSSPYGEAAWRAAKGKAAVALDGELWRLGVCVETNGERYVSVRYDVSERTQRIGYVLASALGSGADASWDTLDDMIHVDVLSARQTYLTDDPDVSQYPQFTVPKGTQFDCMGLYNGEYAYVSAEVKDGRFVDGGAVVWGFVPLRDLTLDEASTQSASLTDIMAKLAGNWFFEAGGSMAEDALSLNADGSYAGGHIDASAGEFVVEARGTWYVTAYNAFQGLYWNDPPYQITFIREDGSANVTGLTVTDGVLSLTNWEGGGGYIPYEGVLDYVDAEQDSERHG